MSNPTNQPYLTQPSEPPKVFVLRVFLVNDLLRTYINPLLLSEQDGVLRFMLVSNRSAAPAAPAFNVKAQIPMTSILAYVISYEPEPIDLGLKLEDII